MLSGCNRYIRCEGVQPLFSITNSATGKSFFIQLLQLVLYSPWQKRTWPTTTEPESCCNPSAEMLTAIRKPREPLQNQWSPSHSNKMQAKVRTGIKVVLWCWTYFFCSCLSFSSCELVDYTLCFLMWSISGFCIVCKDCCNPQMLWEWKGLSSLFLTGSCNLSLLTRPLW